MDPKIRSHGIRMALAMVFCVIGVGKSLAQQASVGTELTADYQLAIGSAIIRAAQLDAPVEMTLKELQKEVGILEAALNSGRTLKSDALAMNLAMASRTLKRLQPMLREADSEQTIHALVDDVKVKNAATEDVYRLFGSARPTPEVLVRINAKKDNVIQNGYAAILVPVGYGREAAWKDGVLTNIPPGAAQATQFTPQAKVKVLPGVYWAQLYKAKLQASSLIKITITTEEIDVNLP
jgi:hypothetical protein